MVQEWIGSQNATIVELVQEWICSGMDLFRRRDDSMIWFRTIVGLASINTVAGGHGNVNSAQHNTQVGEE